MRRLTVGLAVLVLTLGGAGHALADWTFTDPQADAVLPPGALWEYTFTDPTADSAWKTTTGGWATGFAPFSDGNTWQWGHFAYRTYWPVDMSGTLNDDLWVRTAVDLTGFDLNTIEWGLGVDNGFTLYVNGHFVDAANEEGFAWAWEYGGAFSPAYLTAGMNVVAVALEDHGGSTAFDMMVQGNRTVIPEPCALIVWSLLGASGATLGRWRRRKRAG